MHTQMKLSLTPLLVNLRVLALKLSHDGRPLAVARVWKERLPISTSAEDGNYPWNHYPAPISGHYYRIAAKGS